MATKTSSPDLPRVPRFASPDEAARNGRKNADVEEISTSSLIVEDGEQVAPGLPPAPGPGPGPGPAPPPPPPIGDPDATTPFENEARGGRGDIEATVMISAISEEPSFAAPEPEPLPPPKAPAPRTAKPAAKSSSGPTYTATVTMSAVPRGPKTTRPAGSRRPSAPVLATPAPPPPKAVAAAKPVANPAPQIDATRMMAKMPDEPVTAPRLASAKPPTEPAAPDEEAIEATRMIAALADGDEVGSAAVPGHVPAEIPFEATVMITPLGAAIDAAASAPVAAEATLGRDLSGDLIGERYRLLKPLGKGAVGVVYKAEHTLMKKPVAVKVLHPATSRHPSVTQRFVAEARALAQIAHRHVCAATDFGQTDDGEFYLVMEFLQGRTLAELMTTKGRVAPDRAVFIVEQMCAGLAACHKLGIVHRDLKPENVMLVEADGYPDCVKLFDFGIAHVSRGESSGRADAVMGTVEYMAPEQALGDVVDARTDLYSLGVMLFELLTGRLPFEDSDPLEVLRRHIEQPPPSMTAIAPDAGIPPLLEEVVQQLLAKRPADRVQTAEELKARLGQVWAAGGVIPSSGGFWKRASPAVKAGLLAVPVIGLILAVALSGGDDGDLPKGNDDAAALVASDDESQEEGQEPRGELVVKDGQAGEASGDPAEAADAAGLAPAPAPADAGVEPTAQPDAAATSSPDAKEPAVAMAADVAPSPEVVGDGAADAVAPVADVAAAKPPVAGGELPSAESVVGALPDSDLALANLKSGNATAALGQLQALLSKHPNNPHIYFLIGKASSATSNDVQALASYTKAIELEPRYIRQQTLVDTVFAFIDLPTDPTTLAGLKLIGDKLAVEHRDRLAKIALASGRAESRERAAKLLKESGGIQKLEGWQQSAIALRGSTTCEARKPHVVAIGALGDKAALPLLSTLAGSRRGCGATGADDCHACMRTELDAIVASLSAK